MARFKPELNVGLVGTGFMGKAHAFGLTTAARVFDLPFEVVLHTVADATEALAEAAAARLGFRFATADWRRLAEDPTIDAVHVTAPNVLHKAMVLAAIAAGKHVHCEKPLAPLASDAREMAEAAAAAGVRTQMGFNYLCNPMLRLAREMIARGDLGRIVGYRGVHAEDYMADPGAPYTFRHEPMGGRCAGRSRQPYARHGGVPAGPDRRGDGRPGDGGADAPRRAGRRAPDRGGRHRPRLPALPERGERLGRGELGRVGPQDAARLRGLRHEGGRSSSRRSGSTSCTTTTRPAPRACAASRGSRPAPTTRPTAPSASPPATRSASTTSRPSRCGASSKPSSARLPSPSPSPQGSASSPSSRPSPDRRARDGGWRHDRVGGGGGSYIHGVTDGGLRTRRASLDTSRAPTALRTRTGPASVQLAGAWPWDSAPRAPCLPNGAGSSGASTFGLT